MILTVISPGEPTCVRCGGTFETVRSVRDSDLFRGFYAKIRIQVVKVFHITLLHPSFPLGPDEGLEKEVHNFTSSHPRLSTNTSGIAFASALCYSRSRAGRHSAFLTLLSGLLHGQAKESLK